MKKIPIDDVVNKRPKGMRFVIFLLLLTICVAGSTFVLAQAQPQAKVAKVTTVAGGVVNDGRPATSAGLMLTRFAALDKKGNLYIPDADHRIRKVNAKTGIISTMAGNGMAGFSGDGGPARSAHLLYPTGIAFDAKGNLFFSDSGNNRIRKIDLHGTITTVAGNGDYGYNGDGIPAMEASLAQPYGLTFDAVGNLYICDQGNNRVRIVDKQGIITTVAGNGTLGYYGDGGPAVFASLNLPYTTVIDYNGNLYIGDFNNMVVRKVDAQGIITTFAGNNVNGCAGDGGPATEARIGGPGGLAFAAGALLIAGNGCSKVRAVDLGTNIITTVAGSGNGYDGDGHPALSTKFRGPRAVMFDSTGSLLIADRANQRIRRLDSNTGIVSTVAGGVVGDGLKGTAASLGAPNSVSYNDVTGVLYIADTNHNRVRALYPTGTIMTVAGTGITGYEGDEGQATQALLNGPVAVAVDRKGNLYVADQGGAVVRKVDTTGTITTIAWGYGDTFVYIYALATDQAGNLYGADPYRCVIWKISPDGSTITVVAGVPDMYGFNTDGVLATEAWLATPQGVAVDANGNLYIGDSDNNRVRMVNPITGLISTLAGNGECNFTGDGVPANTAPLCYPFGVAADSKGNVFIADYGNIRLRAVNSAGIIQTIAGTGNQGYNGNGLPAAQTNVDVVVGLAVGQNGVLYFSDTMQQRVRKIK